MDKTSNYLPFMRSALISKSWHTVILSLSMIHWSISSSQNPLFSRTAEGSFHSDIGATPEVSGVAQFMLRTLEDQGSLLGRRLHDSFERMNNLISFGILTKFSQFFQNFLQFSANFDIFWRCSWNSDKFSSGFRRKITIFMCFSWKFWMNNYSNIQKWQNCDDFLAEILRSERCKSMKIL